MNKNNFKNSFPQQHQQKVDELVTIAKDQGYITYEEINEILPMTFDSPEQIDQVLIFLSGMDIQILNQSEVERQKERKKEAKELEGLPKRSEGTPDDPVRMYLKEMGSVPLLSREEEVEISKRIEKAQIQIERIIMRFGYSTAETISIAQFLLQGKERFDKCVAEKEVPNKQEFLNRLPKLCALLKQEDERLVKILQQIDDPSLKKNEKAALIEELEKCRIRTQAYLRSFHVRHNIIEDFGELILRAYERFLQLEKEIQELAPRAERNKFAASKYASAKRKLKKREIAAGRTRTQAAVWPCNSSPRPTSASRASIFPDMRLKSSKAAVWPETGLSPRLAARAFSRSVPRRSFTSCTRASSAFNPAPSTAVQAGSSDSAFSASMRSACFSALRRRSASLARASSPACTACVARLLLPRT